MGLPSAKRKSARQSPVTAELAEDAVDGFGLQQGDGGPAGPDGKGEKESVQHGCWAGSGFSAVLPAKGRGYGLLR